MAGLLTQYTNTHTQYAYTTSVRGVPLHHPQIDVCPAPLSILSPIGACPRCVWHLLYVCIYLCMCVSCTPMAMHIRTNSSELEHLCSALHHRQHRRNCRSRRWCRASGRRRCCRWSRPRHGHTLLSLTHTHSFLLSLHSLSCTLSFSFPSLSPHTHTHTSLFLPLPPSTHSPLSQFSSSLHPMQNPQYSTLLLLFTHTPNSHSLTHSLSLSLSLSTQRESSRAQFRPHLSLGPLSLQSKNIILTLIFFL